MELFLNLYVLVALLLALYYCHNWEFIRFCFNLAMLNKKDIEILRSETNDHNKISVIVKINKINKINIMPIVILSIVFAPLFILYVLYIVMKSRNNNE